jgi:hypothetical protein
METGLGSVRQWNLDGIEGSFIFPDPEHRYLLTLLKKGQYLHPSVVRKPGRYVRGWGRVRVCFFLQPHQPSGYTGHEIRRHIPSTIATSNFPSMKCSVAPQHWSALCLERRGSSLSLPCTHLSSQSPGLGDLTSEPLLVLMSPTLQVRNAFPLPPDYPALVPRHSLTKMANPHFAIPAWRNY